MAGNIKNAIPKKTEAEFVGVIMSSQSKGFVTFTIDPLAYSNPSFSLPAVVSIATDKQLPAKMKPKLERLDGDLRKGMIELKDILSFILEIKTSDMSIVRSSCTNRGKYTTFYPGTPANPDPKFTFAPRGWTTTTTHYAIPR